MSQTPLSSYDPNWETRWEDANKHLQSVQWTFLDGRINAETRDRTYGVALQALHAAFEAQFKTVEDYRDYFLRFDIELAKGTDVLLPQFPAGASLAQVKALLLQFRDDIGKAKALKHVPSPYDPKGLSAFATPGRDGLRRQVKDLDIDVGQRSPLRCRLALEVADHEVHACVIASDYGPSATNYIEPVANTIYRSLSPSVGLLQKTQRLLGLSKAPQYRPHQIHFYIYHPATSKPLIFDDFSLVKMHWSAAKGFTRPQWKQYPTTPLWIAEAAADMPSYLPDYMAARAAA